MGVVSKDAVRKWHEKWNRRDMCWGALAYYHAMARRNVGVKVAFLTQYSANLPAKYIIITCSRRLQLGGLSQL